MKADQQRAKEVAMEGVVVKMDVPRALTRRLVKEQIYNIVWRTWEHGAGLEMGENKAYIICVVCS